MGATTISGRNPANLMKANVRGQVYHDATASQSRAESWRQLETKVRRGLVTSTEMENPKRRRRTPTRKLFGNKRPQSKNKPMLNPNSYAVTQAKTNGVSKLILLGTSEPLGTFTWNFGTFEKLICTWNPLPEPNLHWELLFGTSEPLETFTWKFGTHWTLCSEPFLRTWEPLGTFTWNLYSTFRNLHLEPLVCWNFHLKPFTYFEPWNLPEPLLATLLGTLEPRGSFTWNPYLELRTIKQRSIASFARGGCFVSYTARIPPAS